MSICKKLNSSEELELREVSVEDAHLKTLFLIETAYSKIPDNLCESNIQSKERSLSSPVTPLTGGPTLPATIARPQIVRRERWSKAMRALERESNSYAPEIEPNHNFPMSDQLKCKYIQKIAHESDNYQTYFSEIYYIIDNDDLH